MSVAASMPECAFNQTRRRRSRLNEENTMKIRSYDPAQGQAFQGGLQHVPAQVLVRDEAGPGQRRALMDIEPIEREMVRLQSQDSVQVLLKNGGALPGQAADKVH